MGIAVIGIANIFAALAIASVIGGHSHTVVLDVDAQAMLRLQPASEKNASPLNLRSESVFDRVLHDRLQHHAGHNHVERLRIEVLDHSQLVGAKSCYLDVEIVVDEIYFFPQHNERVMLPEQGAQNIRELSNEFASLLRPEPHKGRD